MKRCEDCIHMNICGYYAEFKEIDNDCRWYKGKADFAEVVRCKDCKRFLEYADGKKRIEGADGDCLTRMMHGFDEQFWGVCFDDFCSYGKRKEGRSDE